MKRIFFISCIVWTFSSVHSQTIPPYKYLGNYTQPAPNVGSLGKYVDYPVSYYTGTPNISIPIYNLQDGAAKLSISLSYHASGIRVSELASWVGLGWALNAGGMIARSVRGGPDEGVIAAGASPTGYYQDSGLTKMPKLNYPVNGVIGYANSDGAIFENLKQQLSAGKADCEPDLFTFNFNGYTGKFVFDEYRTPRMLTEEDVKIAVTYNGGDFTSWMITTPDGTRYYFGENSMHEINAVTPNTSSQDPNTQRPSSWFLTRIIYPNSKDTVYFNYAAETYSYFDLGQETKIFGPPGSYTMNHACSFYNEDNPGTVYKTTVSGLRLTSIKSRNYTVSFGAHVSRQDLIGTSYQLDSIKMFNGASQCIKQFLFTYSYFNSTTAAHLPLGALAFMNSDISDTKRLKLLSVREFSGDGLSYKPPYIFTYQESQQLPRRMSYDQDHWGYSNNYSGDRNIRFTPRVSHLICNSSVGQAAIRDPNWPDMQAYSIKAIKDPLGVTTSFDFESHTSAFASPSKVVGGLRIHRIMTQDSVTGISQVRLFDYGSGGVLYTMPQYLTFPKNEFYFKYTGNVLMNPVSYQGYGFGGSYEILRFAIRESQSVVPLQDFQGNHIGYPIVKEIFGANGEGGSKVYYYMADQFFNNSSRLDMSNYTALASIQTDFGGDFGIFGNGHFNDILPQNLSYFTGYMANYYYPEAPMQVDFRRGQLMGEDTYDSSHVLLNSVRNTYKENYHENYWIRGFKLSRTVIAAKAGPTGIEAAYNDALTYYKLHTGVSHLIFSTITDYKDAKAMVTTHRYGYEDTLHTLQTSDTTLNSVGDSIITKTYYSFDYASNATADGIFGKMQKRNMLVPVATRTWKNNQLVGGTITQFKDFATSGTDTFVNPSKIYALETTVPLSKVQAGENIAYTSQFTSLIPSSNFVEKASFNVNGTTGKIIEQKLVNDKNQALIWDNSTNLPLAQVDNALYIDVAYNSFESAETGNWTYPAGSVVADDTAPTGTHAINLSSNPVTKTGLSSSKSYILSFWKKSGTTYNIAGGTVSNYIGGRTLNGYQYLEVTVTGATSVSITGSGNIDELRLHPSTAQMTTYTYDNLLRLIAECSVNSTITYYDYDSFNRLLDIRDQFGNMRKVFEYNYGELSR